MYISNYKIVYNNYVRDTKWYHGMVILTEKERYFATPSHQSHALARVDLTEWAFPLSTIHCLGTLIDGNHQIGFL